MVWINKENKMKRKQENKQAGNTEVDVKKYPVTKNKIGSGNTELAQTSPKRVMKGTE